MHAYGVVRATSSTGDHAIRIIHSAKKHVCAAIINVIIDNNNNKTDSEYDRTQTITFIADIAKNKHREPFYSISLAS